MRKTFTAERDIRDTSTYLEAEAMAVKAARLGSGEPVDVQDFDVAFDGRLAVATATVFDRLDGRPPTRIATIDLVTGAICMRTRGPGNDRQARWSPAGDKIVFLSDRGGEAGAYQVHWLDTRDWAVQAGPRVDGFVESLSWSPDGQRLLLVVAGLAADIAGAMGGHNAGLAMSTPADWLPEIDDGTRADQWRRAWIVEADGSAAPVGPAFVNVWEACWNGPSAITVIASDQPDESAWYQASLRRVVLADHSVQTLYVPTWQLGVVASDVQGKRIAVIDAVCSDRMIVAGDIVLLDGTETPRTLTSNAVDVTDIRFDADHLLFAGHRTLSTVVGAIDLKTHACEEWWARWDCTFGSPRYPELAPIPGGRGVLATIEGFVLPPVVSVLGRQNQTLPIARLGADGMENEILDVVGAVHERRWHAPDGLDIHGWFIAANSSPRGGPVVLDIHGGPVSTWRQKYIGAGARRLLLQHGYSLFLPNPRGSSGRGREFAKRVVGDMGGTDVYDYLTGLDRLIADGLADRSQLYVMGGSYGGFMAATLIANDRRFAAAVAVAPVTDWFSEHLLCHIAAFCRIFLGAEMSEPEGPFLTRSPAFRAGDVRTPVLIVAGGLDHNTPPGQAVEFHRALQEQGRVSTLVIYPGEGHNPRTYPAVIDFWARVVDWFDAHRSLPSADGASQGGP